MKDYHINVFSSEDDEGYGIHHGGVHILVPAELLRQPDVEPHRTPCSIHSLFRLEHTATVLVRWGPEFYEGECVSALCLMGHGRRAPGLTRCHSA